MWAIDKIWLEHKYKKFLPEEINELYEDDPLGKSLKIQSKIIQNINKFSTIININPFYLNERLLIQQGLFLFSSNFEITMEHILNVMMEKDDGKR